MIDEFPVGRVLVPPQLLAESKVEPDGAVGYLVQGLSERQVRLRTISRGWRERVDGAELEVLWPPAGFNTTLSNESSIVLLIRAGRRRILLNGDIQEDAIRALLESGVDLGADMTDLPHHGGFVPASPQWLNAVDPQLVLQSCGWARMRNDKWATYFDRSSRTRLVSSRMGMVEIRIDQEGHITHSSFLKGESD